MKEIQKLYKMDFVFAGDFNYSISKFLELDDKLNKLDKNTRM